MTSDRYKRMSESAGITHYFNFPVTDVENDRVYIKSAFEACYQLHRLVNEQ